jgi:hypothetical protein
MVTNESERLDSKKPHSLRSVIPTMAKQRMDSQAISGRVMTTLHLYRNQQRPPPTDYLCIDRHSNAALADNAWYSIRPRVP